MALPFFAVTLFVSAFLLFLVQPMIGKTILPRLGGTPQVWNTCMVFFQMALLAGYAYTHTVASKLKLRQQLLVHGALLLVPFVVLFWHGPFNIQDWTPPPGANPILSTLLLLTLVVGVPFFVVSTSAPLLQRWFSSTGHPAAKDPYFLYGASNLGSLLALLAYPLLIEPNLRLRGFALENGQATTAFFSQPWIWTFGYVLLAGMVVACAALVWKAPPSVQLAGAEPPVVQQEVPREEARVETSVRAGAPMSGAAKTAIRKGAKQQQRQAPRVLRKEPAPPAALDEAQRLGEVTPWRRLRWVVLAAVPTSLMLGITTYITTDLSPIPLFWLIPLTLYLLTFILVFARWPIIWSGQPHQTMLYIEPVAIVLLILSNVLIGTTAYVTLRIVINVLAFFVVTLACHGELAKDRPSTKHLTEFYLWMSVGGMLGGMFNGLVAPILFRGTYEFPLAVFAACLVRPILKEGGWFDTWFATTFEKSPQTGAPHRPGHGRHVARTPVEPSPQLHRTLDIALPFAVLLLALLFTFVIFPPPLDHRDPNYQLNRFLSFGVPLILGCLFYARPLRLGLAVGAVLLVHGVFEARSELVLYADRSYFGILRVLEGRTKLGPYYSLRHGTTLHGQNFRRPPSRKEWGDPDKDFSRLPNTYYRRRGPAGVVMEKFNWFPAEAKKENTYWADNRMPASIVGLGGDAWSQLVNCWSEPPYATIGLGTGTMASYCRPYQWLDYYEIDNHIRRLSEQLPDPDNPYFTYVRDARQRGGIVRILMGDARLKMAQPYEEGKGEEGGGPEHFYHMMVVDAFSSDAIPIHLLTREAMEMYFRHLTEEGILCVHTSNRHIDLVPVVADVAASLNDTPEAKEKGYKYTCLRGHDNEPMDSSEGFSTSEWVMVARKGEYLNHLKAPGDYDESRGQYWETPGTTGRNVWTDDYSNLMAVYRDFMPEQGRRRR